MAMTLEELLALLPDNTTGDIGADDLRTIVTELYGAANTFAQTFGYTWQANGSNPSAGKVTVSPPWGMNSTTLLINETTEDSQTLVFTLLDTSNAKVRMGGANGGLLNADITGPSVDQGSYREIPITVTDVSGLAPLNNEKMAVAILAMMG